MVVSGWIHRVQFAVRSVQWNGASWPNDVGPDAIAHYPDVDNMHSGFTLRKQEYMI